MSAEAFDARLSFFTKLNFVTVLLPAFLAGLAALVALFPSPPEAYGVPLASILSGSAAILVGAHKALKCDDFQAECQRLSQANRSWALEAEAASHLPEQKAEAAFERLVIQLSQLVAGAKASVPRRYTERAERLLRGGSSG